MSDSQPHASPQAEEIFAEYLVRSPAGESSDFQEMCALHADLANELLVLKSQWDAVAPILARVEQRASLSERLRQKFGEGVDPDVSLEGNPPQADSGPTSELLRRLQEHGPQNERYKILGEFARGGMGAILKVWDEDLRRTLAMKVVLGHEDPQAKSGTPLVDPKTLGRFLEEAQITGQLDHPGIVPVHELGLATDGRVYFTMRLVKGEDLKRIFEHVKTGQDGWNQVRALNVLLRVCEAMSFAHSKKVIHRDLKPANVMVGKFGEVYVMDWGLARVLGREDRHDVRIREEAPVETVRTDERAQTPVSPLITKEGEVFGTPAYMSPEQALGELAAIGPQADVYAVGAMLYHLIARHMPYATEISVLDNYAVWKHLKAGPPRELALETPDAPVELIAICGKAMERNQAHRYRDMQDLAADLRAYLEHRVVRAYEQGTWAETRKWVQRNKPLAASLAGLFLALAGGIVFSTIKTNEAIGARHETETKNIALEAETQRANEKTTEATRNAEETQRVADFQTQMLSDLAIDEFGHTIIVELGRDLRENMNRLGRTPEEVENVEASLAEALRASNPTNVAQRVLEKSLFEPAVQTLEKQFGDKPLLAATVQSPLAGTLRSLGLLELGERAARTAVETRRAALGAENPDTLRSINLLGQLLYQQGKLASAEELCREALAGRQRKLGDEDPDTLQSFNDLAMVLAAERKYSEAEPISRQALAVRRAKFGDDHPDTLTSINNLAILLHLQAKYSEAEPLFRELLALHRAKYGNEDSRTLTILNNLACMLRDQGRYSEAEPLFHETLAGVRTTLGDLHPSTLASIFNLALTLQYQRKFAEAEPLFREVLAGRRARLGDEHSDTRKTIAYFASLLSAEGKRSEAEPYLRDLLERDRRLLGELNRETLAAMHALADNLRDQGKRDESYPYYQDSLEKRRLALGEDDKDTLDSILNMALMLYADKRRAEAEPYFRELLEKRRRVFGATDPSTLTSMNDLSLVLESENKFSEAESLVREATDLRRAKFGDEDFETFSSIYHLAALLMVQKKFSEAEPLFREALAGRLAKLGAEHSDSQKTARALISLYEKWHAIEPAAGHDKQAAELRTLLKQ